MPSSGRNRRRKNRKHRLCSDPARSGRVGADWAGLPRSIMEGVIERLSMLDCLSVSNVCRSWRAAFSRELSSWESRGFPSLLMPGQKDRSLRTCVSMMEKRAWEMDLPGAHGKYCWGSVDDWLVLVDHVEHFSIDIVLFNPFTESEIKLPRTWDFYHKIVLSGPPRREGVVFMLVSGQSRELRFWAPGAQSWLDHRLDGTGDPFEDAVFCGKSFFLLTKDNDIFEIEARAGKTAVDIVASRLRKMEMAPGGEAGAGARRRYLVESRGGVLLVARRLGGSRETKGFEIYDMDLGSGSWRRVGDLGERVVFVGKCSSRTFCARELGGDGMGNCVYFSNDEEEPWWNEWHAGPTRGMSARFGLDNVGRRHWGVFRLGDGDGFCFRGDRDNSGPVWFTAPLWWYCNNFSIY